MEFKEVLRTYLSFVALQNIGTSLQCYLDCGQFMPDLPAAVCRQISVLNLVMLCIRLHTVFAVGQRASHALNGVTSAIHITVLLYDKPQTVSPALGLQILLSGISLPLSVYTMVYCCTEESEKPTRPEKRKSKYRANELGYQAKEKDL